jgi:hypothetical protein
VPTAQHYTVGIEFDIVSHRFSPKVLEIPAFASVPSMLPLSAHDFYHSPFPNGPTIMLPRV